MLLYGWNFRVNKWHYYLTMSLSTGTKNKNLNKFLLLLQLMNSLTSFHSDMLYGRRFLGVGWIKTLLSTLFNWGGVFEIQGIQEVVTTKTGHGAPSTNWWKHLTKQRRPYWVIGRISQMEVRHDYFIFYHVERMRTSKNTGLPKGCIRNLTTEMSKTIAKQLFTHR